MVEDDDFVPPVDVRVLRQAWMEFRQAQHQELIFKNPVGPTIARAAESTGYQDAARAVFEKFGLLASPFGLAVRISWAGLWRHDKQLRKLLRKLSDEEFVAALFEAAASIPMTRDTYDREALLELLRDQFEGR